MMREEIKSWWRNLSFVAVLALFMPMMFAQTSVVDLPDEPPHSHLYHANDGNLFFEKFQSAELIEELQRFARETGFAVYVVTVNSPEKWVFANLQQQIRQKWSHSRDCMVIFYDLDTCLLAVQFEEVYHHPQGGLIAASLLSGVSDQTWISFTDEWFLAHQQSNGLDLENASLFFSEFLGFLRQQIMAGQRSSSQPWGLYVGFAVLALVGFVWFYRYTQKSIHTIRYEFPALRMKHRLKARSGGGLMGACDFAPGNSSRR